MGGARIHIALATTNFVLFQDITKTLREKGLKFVAIAPSDAIGSEIGVVITSKEEASTITFPNVVVASNPEMTVNEAIRLLRNGAVLGCAVIGIDPREEPGIAVVSNGIGEAVYRVPLGQAFGVIERIKQTYSDVLVRIGHGARLASMRLANSLVAQGIPVELVDEMGLLHTSERVRVGPRSPI